MAESKYTRGQWVAGSVLIDGTTPDNEAIVYAGGDADSGAETEIVIRGPNALADAGLIASAPDLLKAGEAVLAALDGRVHSNPALKALVDLSAALSKAKEG